MAITTFTGDLSAQFAAGTSLQARPASNWAVEKRPPAPGTTPAGAAAATATSSASGVLSLTGLADNTEYFVSDSAGTRYVRITTFPERQEVMSNQAGQANGYAKLDANAKVPWAQATVTYESVNPMDSQFAGGAKGGGVIADGAAFAAALAACDGVSRAHMVIPDRPFLIDQQLASDAASGLSITGFGKASKLIAAPGLNKALLRINTSGDSSTPPRIAKVTLKDFLVDHQGTQQADGTEGIKAAVTVYAPDDADVSGLHIVNARNTGLDMRGGRRVRLSKSTVENMVFSLGGNGFNLGGLTGVGQTASSDYAVDGLYVIGSNLVVNDAAITAGQTQFSSAAAGLTSSDVGKCVIIDGAGSAGGRHLTYIVSVALGVATVGNAALTTVSGARAMIGFGDVAIWWGAVNADKFTAENCHVIGGCNSGVLAEGGSGNSKHVDMAQCHVENARNQAFGWATLAGGTVLPHEKGTIDNCTAINPFNGAVAAGNDYLISNLRIDGFLADGLVLGGQDYDEAGTVVSDANIRAASNASGYCVNISKAGGGTNFLRALKLRGCHLDGNGAAINCVRMIGKLKNIGLDGCTIQRAKNAGVFYDASGGAAPKDMRILGGDIRNNNQAANAAGVQSVGVGVNAGDTFLFEGVRVTDDQGSPTQTHAFHWTSGAVNALFLGNDLRGNLTGAVNNAGAFDTASEAYNNKGWSTPTLGSGATVTLVPGQIIKISGTADITSITASNEGRVVSLRFTGTAATNGVVDGSNLKLNGNFAYTPDDMLTLYCDGTNWYEISRSVN